MVGSKKASQTIASLASSAHVLGNDDVRRGHAVCREDMFGFLFLAAVLHQTEAPPSRKQSKYSDVMFLPASLVYLVCRTAAV